MKLVLDANLSARLVEALEDVFDDGDRLSVCPAKLSVGPIAGEV